MVNSKQKQVSSRRKRKSRASSSKAPRRAWKRALGVAAAAGAMVAVALFVSSPAEEAPSGTVRESTGTPLNLVLVSIDTLRADHLSCYGSAAVETPNIDRLADDGVLFENVQSVAPTTLPAHASLFTATTPLRHGVHDNIGFYLPEELPTLASVLSEAGYETGGFVGAFVLDSRFGIGHGFETYYDGFASGAGDISGGIVSQYRGDLVLERAMEWLEDRRPSAGSANDRRKPFFAFLHFYDPHTPYQPPPPFAPREATNEALYRGEVAYVDSLVGKLLDWLDERGLAEETLVVLTADHGESLGEHGELTHGLFLYESTLRVPLLIRYPGARRGGRVRELVRLIDIAPTILDLLALPPIGGADGRSLRPLLEKPSGKAARLNLTAYAETYLPRFYYGWSELRSLRRERYKFILAPRPELYDIDADPSELLNRTAENPRVARQMREELENVIADVATPEPAELDERALARLQSLGYAGGSDSRSVSQPFSKLPDPKDQVEMYLELADPMLGSVEPEDRQSFEAAFSVVGSVLQKDPSVPRAHLLHGELLLKAHRYREAAAAFERLLRLQPSNFSGLHGLALAQLEMNEVAEAETTLRRAIALEPQNTKSYFRLAEIARERGDLEKAEEWLRRGIAVHSDRVLLEKLAEVLLAAGRAAEAETIVAELAEQHGDDAAAAYNLAQALLLRGEAAQALEHLKRAARLSPDDADIRQAMGNALATSGNFARAAAEYRHALSISPCFPAAHGNLGTVLLELGRTDEAVGSFERAIACDPEYAAAYVSLASVLLQKGQRDRAVDALRKASRLRPDDSELKETLERLLQSQK